MGSLRSLLRGTEGFQFHNIPIYEEKRTHNSLYASVPRVNVVIRMQVERLAAVIAQGVHQHSIFILFPDLLSERP